MKAYIQFGPVPVTFTAAIATAVTGQGYTFETPLFAGITQTGKVQVQTTPVYFMVVSKEVEKFTDMTMPDLSALGLTMEKK